LILVFQPAICRARYFLVVNKFASVRESRLQPNNKLCNITLPDGTNYSDTMSVTSIMSIYIRLRANVLNAIRYLHGQVLAGRQIPKKILQRNPSLRVILDQVHFSCKRLYWKVTKYDVHILWLTVSGCERFERPSYFQTSRTQTIDILNQRLHCSNDCFVPFTRINVIGERGR